VRVDPGIGATLSHTPTMVRLTFSEEPEVSLSDIRVLGPDGTDEQRGSPEAVGGEPLTIGAAVRPLPRGVYTVSWKVVSAVDGHATDGSYAFGVGETPSGAVATSSTTSPGGSALELIGRWLLLAGVVGLLGGASAAVMRFGGPAGTELRFAAGGMVVSIVGLLLLAGAQRATADTTLRGLLETSVGTALIWRGVALAGAGVALAVAWRAPGLRRVAMAAAAGAAVAAIVVHVAAGHAAAGSWSSTASIAAQSAHFAAAGVWIGGLAALLLGVRGRPSDEKAAAVRRFAAIAFGALVLILLTGTFRAVDELTGWGQLATSGYGRAVTAKVVLIGLITVVAARNRRSSVPAARSDLRPLRKSGRIEVGLGVAALAVAALLGPLAPPVSSQTARAVSLTVSGSDFATTTRAELTVASRKAGPNDFSLRLEDYDSGEPPKVDGATLRFTPVDDPGIEPSTLRLRPASGGAFVGSGSNLAFDGRWSVDALVRRGAGVIEVPLQLTLPGPKQFVSVFRPPGKPPQYTMQIGSVGNIRIEPRPERAGPSMVYVTCFTIFGGVSKVDELVLTSGAPGTPARQRPVRRLSQGRFVAAVELEPGPFEIGVVAHTRDGTRLRGVFELDVPGG
jgi:copper transport protein